MQLAESADTTHSFRKLARQGALRVLALVQINTRFVAEAILMELRYIADEAVAERAPRLAAIATDAAEAAQRWYDGHDESRAEVARLAIAILDAMPTTPRRVG